MYKCDNSAERKSSFSNLHILPDFDNSEVRVCFSAQEDINSVLVQVSNGMSIIAQENVLLCSRNASCKFKLESFVPWTVDNPFLYEVLFFVNLESACSLRQKFGMVKIRADKTSIYVNDNKFYVRGCIRGREAHDHQNFYDLPLTEFYSKYIILAKQHGFNLIRFHSRIPPEECLMEADRLGMFIHVELRKYYGKYQKERNMMNDEGALVDEELWEGIILKLRNHPCIFS